VIALCLLVLLCCPRPLRAQTHLDASWLAAVPIGHSYITGLEMAKNQLVMFTTDEVWESAVTTPTTYVKTFIPSHKGVHLWEQSIAVYRPAQDDYLFAGGSFDYRIFQYSRWRGAVLNSFGMEDVNDLPRGLVAWGDGIIGSQANGLYYYDSLEGDTRTAATIFGNSGPGAVSSRVGALEWGPDGRLNVLDPGNHAILRYNVSTFSYVDSIALATSAADGTSFAISSTGFIFVNNLSGGGGTIYNYATGDFAGIYGDGTVTLASGSDNGGKLGMTADDSGRVFIYDAGASDVVYYDTTAFAALMAAGTVIDTGGADLTATALAGSGIRTVRGGGSVTLSGAGSYDSGIIVAVDTTLALAGTAVVDTPSILIAGGATPGEVRLAGDASSRSVLLTGGIAGEGTLRFDGGILRSRQDGEVVSPVVIESGGAFLDSNGHEMTISSDVSGTGPLTKQGEGRMILSGTGAWTGGTVVEGGILQFAKTAALPDDNLTIVSGATAAFNIGGAGEFTEAGITGLLAAADFQSGARLGLGTDSGDFTFTAALADTHGGVNSLGLVKLGENRLTLTAANTYTGGTAILGGEVRFTTRASLPDDNLTVASGAAAILDVGGAGGFTNADIASLATGGASTGFLDGSAIGLDTSDASGGSFTLTTELTDTHGGANSLGLIKDGTGTLILTTANTHTGGTTVRGGFIQFSSGSNLGTGDITLAGGGLRWADGATEDLAGRGIPLGSGDGAIDTNGGDITLAADLSGAGGLLKTGAGELTLTGHNTHTGGITVNQDFIQFSSEQNLGTGDITLAGGSGLRLTQGSVATISGRTITLDAGNSVLDTNSGDLAVSATLVGTGTLTKTGLGELDLSGMNTWTGGIVLDAGTLGIGSANALGTGTITINGGEVRAVGAERWMSNNVVINGDFTLGRLTHFLGSVTLTNDVTLTSANPDSSAPASSSFFGTIGGNHRITFTEGDNPTGTIYVGGNNTYTGGTTIRAGTILVGHNNALGTGTVTIEGGTLQVWDIVTLANRIVLDGGTLAGAGTLAGDVTFNSGATLAPSDFTGSAPGTLTFTGGLTLADGTALDFQLGTTSDLILVSGGTLTGSASAGGITLNFSDAGGFAADTTYILFDFTGADLTSFDLSDFTLGSTLAGYDYSLDFSGSSLQLTATTSAVPEPSTYAALAGLAALGLGLLRRRRTGSK